MAKKLKCPCHFTDSQHSCKRPHLVHDKVVPYRLRKVAARVSGVLGGKREAKKGGFLTFPVHDHLPSLSYRAIHKKRNFGSQEHLVTSVLYPKPASRTTYIPDTILFPR